jgi:hypothetical protein
LGFLRPKWGLKIWNTAWIMGSQDVVRIFTKGAQKTLAVKFGNTELTLMISSTQTHIRK